MLVKNARGTGKYQPVGGVYKTTDAEASKLKNLYNVVDDDKIPMDSSTRRDYRMQLPDRYLRRFVRRFNRASIQRENIENLSREFREGSKAPWLQGFEPFDDKKELHLDCIQY